MRLKDWPFRPIHITNDGEVAPSDPLLRKLTGPGIISNSHLQGIQSAICHSLNHPTTVVEFSPEPEGEAVRTDSPLLTYRIRPACKLFRECTAHVEPGKRPIEGWLCRQSDACHAGLFRGLKAPALSAQVLAKAGQCPCFQRLHAGEPEGEFLCVDKYGRTFVEYDCPLLGYREALFPILFEDAVMAAFFMGQITLEHKRDFIEQRMRTLLERQPDCFDEDLRRQVRPSQPADVLHAVLNAHQAWLRQPKSVLTNEEYEGLLSGACKELDKLESQLREEVQHQQQRYIGERVTARLEEFRAGLPSDVSGEDDPLHGLWENVKQRLDGIIKDFSLRYVVVFGVSAPAIKEPPYLEVVASAGSLPTGFTESGKGARVRLDLGELPKTKDSQIIYASRTKKQELLKCLVGCNLGECGDFVLVLHPVPVHKLSSIGILVGYENKNPSTSPENEPGRDLATVLESFYSLVVSSLSAILAAVAERHTHDQLRILGHEAGQLIDGLGWLRIAHLENAAKLRELEEERAKDVCVDLEGFQKQLHYMFKRAELLVFDLPPLKSESFLAFGTLLYKWKYIYRLEAEKKSLQFVMGLERPDDPDRPAVYGDPLLLEQLLYNLVGNAVKYCHRGAKVHLDCRLKSRDPGSPHVLTATDYGREMPATPDVYRLYWKPDKSEPGLGIGLYLARQIAEAHGGRIDHECMKVSDYNVPLIAALLEAPFRIRETDRLRDELRAEDARLRESDVYRDVVARVEEWKLRYRPSWVTLLDEIRQPTYRVTVWVELPRERGRAK